MDQEKETQQLAKQPRGSKRRERTRSDLLAAARRVFTTCGYHEATITQITEAADVGVGTFYLHFRDKDELFNTLIEQSLLDIREQVQEEVERLGNSSPAVVIRAVFRQAYERRDLFRISLMAGQERRRFGGQDMLTQMFTNFLEQASDLSPFAEEDRSLLSMLLTGLIIYALNWWFAQDEPGPDIMADRVLYVMRQGVPGSLFDE